MQQDLLLLTLDALFSLAADSVEPTLGRVSAHVGAPEAAIVDALHHLESRGLVSAEKRRLTMRGLAAAAALHAHLYRAELKAAA